MVRTSPSARKSQPSISEYASLPDAERMRRLLEIADLPDAESHLAEFTSLLCGKEIKFPGKKEPVQ
jgi:hypothetical protein